MKGTFIFRLRQTIHVGFVVIPILLFSPVLYCSLTTPFALIDDYRVWLYFMIFDDITSWLSQTFLYSDSRRYRPLFDLYTAITWEVFGATPWHHRLLR